VREGVEEDTWSTNSFNIARERFCFSLEYVYLLTF